MKKNKMQKTAAMGKRQLRLNRETLRTLTDTQLTAVAGGGGTKMAGVNSTGSDYCSIGMWVGGCR